MIDEVFDVYKVGVELLERLVKKLNEEISFDFRKYIVYGRFLFFMLVFGFVLKIFLNIFNIIYSIDFMWVFFYFNRDNKCMKIGWSWN